MQQVVKLLLGFMVFIPLLFGERNLVKPFDSQENRLLSKLSEKELRGLFKKKSEEEGLESFFGKEKYELITNLDLNGDGKQEKLYGQRYEIEFNKPLRKDKFYLKKAICFGYSSKRNIEILFIADEDRFLTQNKTIFSFDPAEFKGQSFLRWWFMALYPQLIKENAFLMNMKWIESREEAKHLGGGGGLSLSALRWNPKTEDFEVDEELSKKYAY